MATRKEINKQLINDANSVIENAFESTENYTDWLNYMLDCPRLSVNNMAILHSKYSHPIPKTKKQWESLGYKVTVPLKEYTYLLRPNKYDGFYEHGQWTSYKKATKEQKKAIERGEIKRVQGISYVPYFTFDISQTNASEEDILLQSEELIPKNYEFKEVCENYAMDTQDVINFIKNEIKLYEKDNDIKKEYIPMYEAGIMYLATHRLGFDAKVSNFYLLHELDKNQLSECKRIMRLMLMDSDSIVDDLMK